MSNINISVSNNTLTWPQNEPLNRYEIQNQLGINATTSDGTNLNNNVKLDLSRINVYMPGTYHGSINVTNPQNGDTDFMNFNVTILPAGVQPVNNPKQATKDNDQKKKSKKKKLIAIGLAILTLILVIASCTHVQNQKAQQQKAEQQVNKNTQGVKSNAAANADMQKQIDQLKDAQAKYQQDHDKQAYQQRIGDLENENSRLESQVKDSDLAQRIQNFGNDLNNAAANPENAKNSAENIAQQNGLNGLWSKLQATFYNWLNS